MGKKNSEKICIKIIGKITFIGDLVEIPRDHAPTLLKQVLTVETFDNQKLFPEIINNKISLLKKENIEVDSAVEIDITFEGSEKKGKRYNNLHIHKIKKLG